MKKDFRAIIRKHLLSGKVVLGSSSPRRKEIFSRLGLRYRMENPPFDEDTIGSHFRQKDFHNKREVLALVRETVRGKIGSISSPDPVFCFDTVIWYRKQVFGKPKNEAEAIAMLAQLSGRTHQVITGCAVKYRETLCEAVYTTKVSFRPVGEKERLDYLRQEQVMDAAGAYKIQGKGLRLVRDIRGSYHNIIGLPIEFIGQFY